MLMRELLTEQVKLTQKEQTAEKVPVKPVGYEHSTLQAGKHGSLHVSQVLYSQTRFGCRRNVYALGDCCSPLDHPLPALAQV